MRVALAVAWFLLLTVINVVVWRVQPCDWSHPYR